MWGGVYRNPLPQRDRVNIVQQGRIADLTGDENYRLTGDLYVRMQECIRCYCLGEICDVHVPDAELRRFPEFQTGPFAPVEHWTEKAFRWSMTWLLVFALIALLCLIGGSDMKW